MTRLEGLYQRLEVARQACGRANRWGEARRFAGRMAGNRLDKIAHIQQMIHKEYTKMELTNNIVKEERIMARTIVFATNRLAETIDRMKARVVLAQRDIEAGNPPGKEKMQYVFDSDMAQLERQYRALLKLLE